MKNKLLNITYIGIAVFSVLFEWLKFDLMIKARNHSPGAGLVAGDFVYLIYLTYLVMIIISIIIPLAKIKKPKLKYFIPLVVVCFTLTYHLLIRPSAMLTDLNYHINSENRQKTVTMIEKGEIVSCHGDPHEYLTPYRLISQTGKVYVNRVGGDMLIMFYTYKGIELSSRLIVYVSDDSRITSEGFNIDLLGYKKYSELHKLAPNWYSVTVTE